MKFLISSLLKKFCENQFKGKCLQISFCCIYFKFSFCWELLKVYCNGFFILTDFVAMELDCIYILLQFWSWFKPKQIASTKSSDFSIAHHLQKNLGKRYIKETVLGLQNTSIFFLENTNLSTNHKQDTLTCLIVFFLQRV